MFRLLSNFRWKLYISLLCLGLFPSIYTSVRLFLINDFPSEYGLNIASQIQWLSLLYEIIQEGLILPLFFLFGGTTKQAELFQSRVKTALFISLLFYSCFSFLIFINSQYLLNIMNSASSLALSYIRLESIAYIFVPLNQVTILVLSFMNDYKKIFLLIAVQTFLTIIFDIFFISKQVYSLELGVLGIAYSNILSYGLSFCFALFLINKSMPIFKTKLDFSWFRQWFKIGGLVGIESLVRNLAYMYMIVYMMNAIAKQGIYWQATSFIWAWLLLPILKLTELIKRDTGEGKDIFSKNYPAYIFISACVLAIWLMCIPFYDDFLKNILNAREIAKILQLLTILLPCYAVFSFGQIWNSYLYGIGRTDMILYASLFMNLVYYSLFYIFYKVGIFIPSLSSISLMFGGGLILSSCISFIQFKYLRKNSAFEE